MAAGPGAGADWSVPALRRPDPVAAMGFCSGRRTPPDGWRLGALLLGMLFALAFCPTSGLFYFGVLIPMAAPNREAICFRRSSPWRRPCPWRSLPGCWLRVPPGWGLLRPDAHPPTLDDPDGRVALPGDRPLLWNPLFLLNDDSTLCRLARLRRFRLEPALAPGQCGQLFCLRYAQDPVAALSDQRGDGHRQRLFPRGQTPPLPSHTPALRIPVSAGRPVQGPSRPSAPVRQSRSSSGSSRAASRWASRSRS